MELIGLFSLGAAAPAATTVLGQTALTSAAGTAFGATLPAVASSGIGLGTIFSGISAGAQLLQGLAGYRSGQANAGYLEAAAQQSLEAGAANKDIVDRRIRAQLGEQRAQAGAQGTTMSGSPLLVYLDSVQQGAIESANEYYQGKVKQVGYKSQAKIAKMGGEANLWQGIVGGAGTLGQSLLGGGSTRRSYA